MKTNQNSQTTVVTLKKNNPVSVKEYAYYPGCSLHSTAREYDVSTRLVCDKLGISLKEMKGWICCGASAAHSTDTLLSLALPAQNLKLAEETGLPLAIPCAMCFSRLKITMNALKDEKTKESVERSINASINGVVDVQSVLQVLDVDIPTDVVKHPLHGLKVACYYGCLLVRPGEIMNLDDVNNPQIMDRIVERLGAESLPWGLKTECCGASLTVTRSDIVSKLSQRLLLSAKNLGADCIVVACPMCHMNLDMEQKVMKPTNGNKIDMPIIFFTQLMGIAMGISYDKLLLNRHFIEAKRMLKDKGLI